MGDENSKFGETSMRLSKFLEEDSALTSKNICRINCTANLTVKVQWKCSKTIVNRTWPAVVAVAICQKYSGRTQQKVYFWQWKYLQRVCQNGSSELSAIL